MSDRVRTCPRPVDGLLLTEEASDIAAIFKALGDPTRVQILRLIRDADDAQSICVCDLTAAFGLAQATVSHHMARLRAVGLVDSYKEGVRIFYVLASDLPPIAKAALEALP